MEYIKYTKTEECPYCGKTHDYNDIYCENCGRELIKPICKVCGNRVSYKIESYCPKCGTKYPLKKSDQKRIQEIGSKSVDNISNSHDNFGFLAFCVVLIITCIFLV